jgi:hypothetical protein
VIAGACGVVRDNMHLPYRVDVMNGWLSVGCRLACLGVVVGEQLFSAHTLGLRVDAQLLDASRGRAVVLLSAWVGHGSSVLQLEL